MDTLQGGENAMLAMFAAGAVALLVLGALRARRAGRRDPARLLGVLGGAVPVGYLALLLAASLTSHEKVLGLNQEKDFCGFYLDCHLSLSVVNVAKTRVLSGVRYVVIIKFRNNARPRTEGERAFTLKPYHPVTVIVDDEGRTYERATDAEQLLVTNRGGGSPLVQRIAAGNSYTADLVFDLPADVRHPRLFVTEGFWLERALELFLIGDEDSLLHKRTAFRLTAAG